MPIRLKALELQGYKTFANRTLFEFAGAVTAVVGPNGSGKSNIADSMRWVLGEQSFHLLRGKKTEDMIFSGSELRPRASMASATITFDNLDGWLPIDFSEVAITRRAYRDGSNEYLINGQRVRLKDVSELLAQSGLAERTYTIIGQGLVDAALALRAEDRRKLFEEAAGIGLYRSRREEALRRLETTQRNLERVSDILVELEPRKNSLEKQARRASEYDQIKADMQVLLRDWYGYHWHRSASELIEARQAARTQERALESARGEQVNHEEQLNSLKEATLSARSRAAELRRQQSELHNRRELLDRDLAVAGERMRSLDQQRQNASDELSRLEEELLYQNEMVESSRQEVSRLEGELLDARQQAQSARQSLADRQQERQLVENAIAELRQKIINLTSRQGQLEVRILERQDQIEREQIALAAADRLIAQHQKDLQSIQDRLVVAESARQDAEQRVDDAEQAYREYQQRLDQLEAARREALEHAAANSTDQARLNAQRRVFEQAEAALTGYGEGPRRLLQAIRQERLAGKSGALSQYLDIPPELETAIGAILGEFVEAVLVNTEAEPVLDVLEEQSGRAVILPLERIRPVIPTPVSRGGLGELAEIGQGWIGVASDLVSTTSEIRPVVDLLLGSVWVVRDRQVAVRILEKLAWTDLQPAELARLRLVTLAGQVFYAAGPVIGVGRMVSETSDGSAGLLSRQRQQRELIAALELRQSESEEIEARRLEVERQLEALHDPRSYQAVSDGAEPETPIQALATARKSAEAAGLDLNQRRLEFEQIDRQVTWQRDQRQRLEGTIQAAGEDLARYRQELEDLEKQLAQRKEDVRMQNNQLAGLMLDDYQLQLSHWNTLAAVLERGLDDGQQRMSERINTVKKTRLNQETLRGRILTAQVEAGGLIEARETHQIEVEQAGEQLAVLASQIDPLESELQTLDLSQAGLEEVLAAARQAVSLADHHHAQTRIVVERRQEAVETLHRRIEEDFGLVNFDYTEEETGQEPLPLAGMVEQLPRVAKLSPEIDEGIRQKRAQLRRIGPVNPEARAEYREVKERYNFMTEQVADLQKAELDVREVIHELDILMERDFLKTFEAVAVEFKTIFQRLFNGGTARLVLSEPETPAFSGIDIEARLPGRRTQGLSLLSGGERSLTATSLIFALLKVSPTPFCVLDEVDAMLDEANVGRFRDLLTELSQKTQFVVVTHNRNTVQAAEVIYGVTMGRDSASQVVSLKMDDLADAVEA